MAVLPEIAQEVEHDRGLQWLRPAEREAAHRPDVLLELGGLVRVKGLVAAIVRTRSELVDDNAPVLHKHLDGQKADELDLVGDTERQGACFGGRSFGDAGRRNRKM